MEIPKDVQEDIKDICTKEAKNHKRNLHQAVNAMDNARQEYEKAMNARAQLHAQWKSFLTASLKLWQDHTVNFQKQEAQLTERIKQAKDSFVLARDVMNTTKLEAAAMIPVDVDAPVQVSDDEELKDVPMVAAERIAHGLSNMVETMTKLQSQAEEIQLEEQKPKRPRISESVPASGANAAKPGEVSSASIASFGAPGGQ